MGNNPLRTIDPDGGFCYDAITHEQIVCPNQGFGGQSYTGPTEESLEVLPEIELSNKTPIDRFMENPNISTSYKNDIQLILNTDWSGDSGAMQNIKGVKEEDYSYNLKDLKIALNVLNNPDENPLKVYVRSLLKRNTKKIALERTNYEDFVGYTTSKLIVFRAYYNMMEAVSGGQSQGIKSQVGFRGIKTAPKIKIKTIIYMKTGPHKNFPFTIMK